jgi:tRNA (guanine-N7-)-methyltransferase
VGEDRSRRPAEVGSTLSEAILGEAILGEDEKPSQRRAVFYGRRQARKLPAIAHDLIASLLPRVRATIPLDLAGFDSWELEIGFGGGEHLAAHAAARREVGFLGAEPFLNGVSMLLQAIDRDQLTNVRIWPEDARLLLDALPDAALSRIYLLFPDPWPKRRHEKRRFLQTEMLDVFARVLRQGGELRFASDHPGLMGWMLARADAHAAFAGGPVADQPIGSRYERKNLAGHPARYAAYRRE